MNINIKYDLIYKNLTPDQQDKLKWFFINLNTKITGLNLNQKKLMVEDFKKAVIYYLENKWETDKILKTIDTENLGSFYVTESDNWYPLDNGAKIFPLSMTNRWMSVFRLSAYMKEDIVPELLQLALTFTIKRFPYFATTIKKGVFWHYIDSNLRHYRIRPEFADRPCAYIKQSKYNSQSFKAVYYKNRISVEFFHILTDGAGGMVFLKTLVAEYLRLIGKNISISNEIIDINSAPIEAEWSNDYVKAEKIKTSGNLIGIPSLQLDGKILKYKPCKILHFTVDADSFYNLAKSKNATVTALMLAYIIVASKKTISSTHGNIQIQVPINIRKYFNSKTLRNFTIYATIRVPINQIDDFDELVLNIKNQLANQTAKESIDNEINLINNAINTLKYIPLTFKRLIALGVRRIGTRVFTNTLSNLGVVKTPQELSDHIDKMDFILGNPANNRVSCAMITYNNKLVLSIAKATLNSVFEESLYAFLKNDGLNITVQGSAVDENRSCLP